MSITFNESTRIFTLNTAHSTYQMQADMHNYLLHLYYGARTAGEMGYLLSYADRGFSGNPHSAEMDRTYSLDALPQEYPSLGTGDFRNFALNIENADGSQCCDPVYVSHKITKGKYNLSGLPAVRARENEAETLEILLADPNTNMEIHLLYGVLEKEDIITRSVIVKNAGEASVTIRKAQSACLDFLHGDYDLIKFYGRHAMERNMERVPVSHGSIRLGSRRGTSSHQYNPGVILAQKNANEDSGSCYGMLLVYSGNFLCEAEKDQYNQTRLQMGLTDELFAYPLAPGAEFTAPEVILSYSNKGFSRLSQQYHHCIMNHICQGKYVHENRPVLINSWEAAYFDFTGDTIVELAKQAKELGIDMVVMDDGWFGKRNDDNSSLGDWCVNEEKLGGTLSQLIERVNAEGVKFGIWIEPEMVNEDSELYRKHPDWAITIPGRNPIRSRNQLLLDFSRKEVRNHIFEQICAVLDQGNIEYVKWDMNRPMTDIPYKGFNHKFTLGFYKIMDAITSSFPNVLFEGCSGGGGRFDAGILAYMPQIWASDNSDAVKRMEIQYSTSIGYPVSSISAHVTAVPNHQNGRVTNLKTRADVAYCGVLGYELDITKMSDEELLEVRNQIELEKKLRPIMLRGDFYRLQNPYTSNYCAWEMVMKNQSEAFLMCAKRLSEANCEDKRIRLQGLDPDLDYIDTFTGNIYGGDELMYNGITPEFGSYDFATQIFYFRKVEK